MEIKRKAAVVTGASSGIGLAISRQLCAMGYEVFGIGRDFSKDAWNCDVLSSKEPFEMEKTKEELPQSTERFHPIVCDLTQTACLLEKMKVLRAQNEITLLVNNAGVGYYGLHEELSPGKIQEMVRVNLEVPMILTNFFLRTLKKNQGMVINISSVTATQASPHGCAYGATKAGLSAFSKSLFEESRKTGVKVVTIQPDMTVTDLYRNADFTASEEEGCCLYPEDVAAAVKNLLEMRESVAVTEMTIRPQKHRIQKKKK